jgi:hypothetical protein
MTVLTDQIHRTVAIWIDDVVVFKANAELLAKELRVIFKLFRKFGVKLNPDKTTLYGEEIRFCGKLFHRMEFGRILNLLKALPICLFHGM